MSERPVTAKRKAKSKPNTAKRKVEAKSKSGGAGQRKSRRGPEAGVRSARLVPPAEPSLPPAAGSEEAYLRFLPEARALAPRDIAPWRGDAGLVHHNVSLGVKAVLEHEPRVCEELPKIDLGRVKALPDLTRGLVFASAVVEKAIGAPGQAAPLLREARTLRTLMLTSADALALAGYAKGAEVDRIREGTGPRDAAQDCVDLAAFFRKHEAVRTKTPVTLEQTRRAAEIGTILLDLLRPSKARRAKAAPDLTEAVDARDRLYTLVVQGHAELRKAGGWLFGEERDRRVPLLGSRVLGSGNRGGKGAPAPAPDAAAPTERAAAAPGA